MRNLIIKKYCAACRAYFEIEVDPEDYKKWETGAFSCKDSLPYLNDNEICLILYDMCEECYAVKTGELTIF